MSILLSGAHLLTNNGKRELLRADLRIEDGRISAIKKGLKKRPKEKVVPLDGQLLIPGFVQTHVHLCQTLFRNLADDLELLDWLKEKIWPFEGAHDEKSLYASARLGIAELLSGGTTTILDMGTVRHTEVIFEAADELGIRAFIGKCLMDRPDMPPSLKESTNEALEENFRLAERWHGKADDRLRYAHAPRFVISCTEDLLREVHSFSSKRRQLIHTHASENRSELETVRRLYGKENIEYFAHLGLLDERLVLAHCIWLSDKEKDLLAKACTKVSHCPSSNLKLASGIAKVPELRKHGICVSLGADGAPCNNNLNMFQEMRLASLLQKPEHGPKAMSSQEVFEMATLEGARALGLESEIGSIELGKKADLVAVDLRKCHSAVELTEKKPESAYSALVYSAGPQNVTHTFVDGRLVYRMGTLPGKKLDDIVGQALKEQRRLLARV